MTDPNHWVQNPPSTIVKIQDTSRADYNGQLAIVLQYMEDRGRYMVTLCANPQTQVALKSDNLQVAGMIDKAKGYYQILCNSPEIRRQYEQISNQVELRTKLKLEYVLIILVIALAVGWYFLGITRTLTILMVLFTVLTILGPDLVQGKPMAVCLNNAPMRWREIVRTQIPMVGPRIAVNEWYLRGFTALVIAFVAVSLIPTSASRKVINRQSSYPSSIPTNPTSPPTSLIAELQQKYYKLGFEDATQQKDYGTSFPAPELLVDEAVDVISNDDTGGYSSWRRPMGYDNAFGPEQDMYGPSPKKSPFTISTAMSLFAIYSILYPKAVNGEGRFDLQLLIANLSNIPVYQMGVLALSLYRLVNAFL